MENWKEGIIEIFLAVFCASVELVIHTPWV